MYVRPLWNDPGEVLVCCECGALGFDCREHLLGFVNKPVARVVGPSAKGFNGGLVNGVPKEVPSLSGCVRRSNDWQGFSE